MPVQHRFAGWSLLSETASPATTLGAGVALRQMACPAFVHDRPVPSQRSSQRCSAGRFPSLWAAEGLVARNKLGTGTCQARSRIPGAARRMARAERRLDDAVAPRFGEVAEEPHF